ncbi:MAG TPA: ParB/RepB/Spo0J family partition protein [Terriglobales bacterium]
MTTAADKTDKRRALGRGLDSLLPSGPRIVAGTAAATPAVQPIDGGATTARSSSGQSAADQAAAGDAVVQVEIDKIDQNPYQTRVSFNAELLNELAESIKTSGVVQPIVVRPGREGRYVLILGERRCRASKLAGKTTIPAMVRAVSDQQAAEMTVVENLQRQDLNCMEAANAYAKLSQGFGMTQEQIAGRVGVSRETIANHLRLLKLPVSVIRFLEYGALGFSEARALLRLSDAPDELEKMAHEAVKEKLSVAQIEDAVDEVLLPQEAKAAKKRWVDPNVAAVQGEMERSLGMRVQVKDRNGKGKIVIQYASLDDFDRVVELLSKRA